MYGFKRAGSDFGFSFDAKVEPNGWKKIQDVEQSAHFRKPVLMIEFVDDLYLTGPREPTFAAFMETHKLFGFSQKCLERPFMENYVGLNREVLYTDEHGTKFLLLHQMQYCDYWVKRYLECKKKAIAGAGENSDQRRDGGQLDQAGLRGEDAEGNRRRRSTLGLCAEPDGDRPGDERDHREQARCEGPLQERHQGRVGQGPEH